MQKKTYFLSLLLLGMTTNIVKPNNTPGVTKKEIETMLDERFAKLQKHMNRNLSRRILRSPFKLAGMVGLSSAWGVTGL